MTGGTNHLMEGLDKQDLDQTYESLLMLDNISLRTKSISPQLYSLEGDWMFSSIIAFIMQVTHQPLPVTALRLLATAQLPQVT